MEQLDYMTFLVQKQQSARPEGIKRIKLPDRMFDFQRHLTEWALKQGRSAIFADCGMGKSLMLMSWAENVVRETNKPVLVVTPLAVTAQIIREAYGAVTAGRRAIGVELKESYFRQAVKNMEQAARIDDGLEKVEYEQVEMFGEDEAI